MKKLLRKMTVILRESFTKKKFESMKTIMSDYISEEDYPLTGEQKAIIFSKEDKVKVEALD